MSNVCLDGLVSTGPLLEGGAAWSSRQAVVLTYISLFSNRFCRFSFIASLETLLSKVRSETPTSFFFVVSNVAFLMFGLLAPPDRPPPPVGALLAAAF